MIILVAAVTVFNNWNSAPARVYYTIDMIRDREFKIPAFKTYHDQHYFFVDLWGEAA